MGISAYTLVSAIVFYNIALALVLLLRRSRKFMARYTVAALGVVTLMGGIRLVLPLEFPGTLVICSTRVLPAIVLFLRRPLPGNLPIGTALLLLWAAGTLVCLLRDLCRQLRYLHQERQYRLVDRPDIARIAASFPGRFRLIISPDVETPYVRGLFRPAIFVPDLELNEGEWRDIFCHETQHILALDSWKKLFFHVVGAIFWWDPLCRSFEREASLLIEMACDERVAGKGNLDGQEAYLRTMLKLMKRGLPARETAGSRIISGAEEMKLRFFQLQKPKSERAAFRKAALSAVLVALFLLSYAVVIQPKYGPVEEDITVYQGTMTAEDITDQLDQAEELVIKIEDGEYILYVNGNPYGVLYENALEDPPFSEIPIIGG